ncbi:choline-binding surface protein A [Streptococcus pneumoniae]|nr:choline-binding surface protein A [Streptococcus pneumoniae]
MSKSNHERRMRYSIRKFSVGVASVLVASFFMGSVAHASELVKDDSVKTTEIAATNREKENDAKSGWGGIIDGSGKLLGGFSEIKEKLEKEIDESSLTSEQKKSYKEKIVKVKENDVDGLFGVHREYLNQLDFQYLELSKVEEEFKYQEEQIQRMFEQKGITNEDKDAMLKKIAEIHQEAEKDIKASGGYRDKLNGAKVKFLQNLDKLFTSTKSKFEKEMQELYRKKEAEIVKEKHLEKDKIYDDADVQKLRELEEDALKKLDEAKTNEEALRVKLEFARNVEKNSQQVQKVDDKLQELIKEAKRELEKLNQGIAEVDKLPELPANDSDYMVQKKYIWDEDKETIPKKIAKFKENLGKKTYTKESLQKFIDDCIYYQTHAKIEVMTRKVAGYRKAYPNNSEIEKEFVSHIKQTSSLTYASLENDSLKRYFEKDFAPAFERIKQIVEGLEKPHTPAQPGIENQKPSAPKTEKSAEQPKAGWKQENGMWYFYNTDGSMATGWLQNNGSWYYLNANGAMVTGWLQNNGSWYYLNANGDMATGWLQYNGSWYYLNANGDMATGWLQYNGSWYYLNANGDMATDWVKDGDTWYYLEVSGAMKASQWFKVSDKWYYVNGLGALAVNTTVDGYRVNANGEWVN